MIMCAVRSSAEQDFRGRQGWIDPTIDGTPKNFVSGCEYGRTL